jgi:hypothetical protein
VRSSALVEKEATFSQGAALSLRQRAERAEERERSADARMQEMQAHVGEVRPALCTHAL